LVALRRLGLTHELKKADLAPVLAAHPKRRAEILVIRWASGVVADLGDSTPTKSSRLATAFIAGDHATVIKLCSTDGEAMRLGNALPCVLAACLAGDAAHAKQWEPDLGTDQSLQPIRDECTARHMF
jgi:hypothetical protein